MWLRPSKQEVSEHQLYEPGEGSPCVLGQHLAGIIPPKCLRMHEVDSWGMGPARRNAPVNLDDLLRLPVGGSPVYLGGQCGALRAAVAASLFKLREIEAILVLDSYVTSIRTSGVSRGAVRL